METGTGEVGSGSSYSSWYFVKVVQQVKVFASEPNDMNLTPRTHTLKGKN